MTTGLIPNCSDPRDGERLAINMSPLLTSFIITSFSLKHNVSLAVVQRFYWSNTICSSVSPRVMKRCQKRLKCSTMGFPSHAKKPPHFIW